MVWSGCWNLIGVLAATGAVAFALLIAAIIWNLGARLGLPASSHTLIGSLVGVGVTNAMMRGQDGTAGVDWEQVTKIGYALLPPLMKLIIRSLALAALT